MKFCKVNTCSPYDQTLFSLQMHTQHWQVNNIDKRTRSDYWQNGIHKNEFISLFYNVYHPPMKETTTKKN
jgi:hypothetical protein